MQFPEFLAFRARSRARSDRPEHVADMVSLDDLVPSATPEERIDAAYTEITDDLRAAFLKRVITGTPQFFEKIVVDLLTSMG